MLGRRFGWYAHRLAAMSGAEVGHRISEQAKRWVSRLHHPDLAASIRSERLPSLPAMAQGLAALKHEEALLNHWREIAQRVREGRVRLLGLEWPGNEDDQLPWHLDPVTGRQWPAQRYCFAIPYRHSPEMGDVKYVWELNRLQFLQPIAALAAVENDSELTRFCIETVDDWIAANPPFKGVNWASGIELACRIVSLLTIFSLLPHDAISRERRRRFLATLSAHGYWLMRYPSRFSSANNHLIAEAGGLYLLGVLAPELPGASEWRQYGHNTLSVESQKQILPDGVGAEQSPTYTAFSLEWLMLCAVVSDHLDDPFPNAYRARIEKAGEFLRWITDAGGHQPRIGDDDEGRVIYSQASPEAYVSSILGCLANFTHRTELAPPVAEPHLREALFGRIRPYARGPLGVRCFEKGGYTVARSLVHGKEILWVMDHGPLGYLSIAAHGHADTLAVWLHVDGQPVLIDAGTYLYHAGGKWRDYFRSTAAHNTMVIDSQDSSLPAGAFNWATKAKARIVELSNAPEGWSVTAEQDGYQEPFGVIHRRSLRLSSNAQFSLYDRLLGSSHHLNYNICFLLAPNLAVKTLENSFKIQISEKTLLEIFFKSHNPPPSKTHIHLVTNTRPYSPQFSHKQPTTQLSIEVSAPIDTEHTVETLFNIC